MPSIPPKTSSRRPPATLSQEVLSEQINVRLEFVEATVETLIVLLSKGELQPEAFSKLHQSAARDERLADLAFAYEQATQERRVRNLSTEVQGALYGHVAEFYDEFLADRESALNWAERAVAVHPCAEPHFARFERWITTEDRGPSARLGRARVAVAKSVENPEARRGWLAQALYELSSDSSAGANIESLESILLIDPDYSDAAKGLETRLLEAGRYRDAARRMEARLQNNHLEPHDILALRARLLGLYSHEMADPFKAIGQAEMLLVQSPQHVQALEACERLLSVASVAPRAISALADAYYDVGNLDRAASLLSQELKVARGPRRQEVQGKLAVLRQDILGDAAGALELLGPVVAVDASRDDFRARFVQLSLSLNRTNDAVRLLGRALQGAKEAVLRTRLACDLGIVLFHAGEMKRSRNYLEDVVRAENDPFSTLRAARLLVQMYQQSDETQPQLVDMLDIVVAHETDVAAREQAARLLIELCRQRGDEEHSLVTAWQALVHSEQAAEALAYLRNHYEITGQQAELASVLELVAARCPDATERTTLYWQAAELRAQGTRDSNALIELWRNLMLQCGASRDALDRLIPLLEFESRAAELADALQLRIDLAQDAEKAATWSKLGSVRLRSLNDPTGALRCHANAVALDGTLQASRVDLEYLLEFAECRAEAAILLEPLLRADAPTNSLFVVLAVRAESSQSIETRFGYYTEAFQLAVEQLGQSSWGLRVACRALRDATALNLDNAELWVQACARLQASVLASERVLCFMEALDEYPLDRLPLRQIAVMASDALHETGQTQEAEALLRRALEYDPSSPDLLMRLDEILASQAGPEERLRLYQDALARNDQPERQRDIYARIANLLQRELSRSTDAIEVWKQVITLDPQHLGAHQALLGLYQENGDIDAVVGELERGLTVASGERRQRMLEQVAQVEERRGNLPQALNRAQESLQLGPLDPGHLVRVQKLAERVGDLEALQGILEQRVPLAKSEDERIEVLRALAEVYVERGQCERATSILRDAAGLARRVSDLALERKLLERAVDLGPNDLSSLTRLVEHCASIGDITAVRDIVEPWLAAGAEERDVLRLILDLETNKYGEQQAESYEYLCEKCAALVTDASRARTISLAAARVLNMAEKTGASAKIYRNLIADAQSIDREVLAAFTNMLSSCPDTPAWREEWRWLFEQRVEKASDKVAVLLEWTNHEEQRNGDISAALAAYDRILDLDSARFDVWLEVARLRQMQGDHEGTLAALEQLAKHESPDKQAAVVVRQAQLLVGPMGRAPEALDRIESVLAENPSDPDVLSIIKCALDLPQVRTRAAEMLQRVVGAVADPESRIAVLEALLDVTNDTSGFDSARAQWTLMLLDLRPEQDSVTMSVVLREAVRLKTQDDLWDRAEKIARQSGEPGSVLSAYREAFDESAGEESAEHVGRRLIEFQEEWSEETSQTLPLLQTIFERCSDAFWAFDRLKLAYNSAGRWDDLFALYDQSIVRVSDADGRAEMLREAAMAAKDFANDARRAIEYFGRLDTLRPNDVRVEAALERLYERQNLTRPLIDLLVRQMGRARDVRVQFPLATRITNYWLDIGEALPAFELLEGLLKGFTDQPEVVELLERLVALPTARDSFPPQPTPCKKEKRERVKPLSIRDRAALRLRQYYESVGRTVDVVRMLEIEVDLAVDQGDRISRLRHIIDVRLSELGDVAGAFENAVTLLQLAPERDEIRGLLDELAARHSARNEQAGLLVAVSERFTGAPLRVVLLREAADITCNDLKESERAIDLYSEVLETADKDYENARRSARMLDQLLFEAGRPSERCDVLEKLATLESDGDVKRRVLGEAASAALNQLDDPARAVSCWRKRLALDAGDTVARDGLIRALERTTRFEELIEALAERADRSDEASQARADRVRIATIWNTQLQSADSAILAWQRVRDKHGRDQDSYSALVELFTSSERWRDLALLVKDEAEVTTDETLAMQLRQLLGSIYAERLGEVALALQAYIDAQDWQQAIFVATGTRSQPHLALEIGRDLT